MAPEYHPDATIEEQKEMEDKSKERTGIFHCWVNDVDTSKDVPYIKTFALVEDIKNGEVHKIEYENMKFDPLKN